jgi:hypothetical protein
VLSTALDGGARTAEPALVALDGRRRVRRPALLGLGAVVVVIAVVAVLLARGGGDGLRTDTVPDVLSMKVPSGWVLQDDGRWDDPVDLGPNAVQAHAGTNPLGFLEEDARAFVFVGVPDEDEVARDLEGLRTFLDQQAAVWNRSGTCLASQDLESSPLLVRRRWTSCRLGGDTMLQQAWRVEGRPVYALTRLNDELSEDRAVKMLESLTLLSPSG